MEARPPLQSSRLAAFAARGAREDSLDWRLRRQAQTCSREAVAQRSRRSGVVEESLRSLAAAEGRAGGRIKRSDLRAVRFTGAKLRSIPWPVSSLFRLGKASLDATTGEQALDMEFRYVTESQIGYRVFFPADRLVLAVSREEAQILRSRHEATDPSAPIVVAPPLPAEPPAAGPLDTSGRPDAVRTRMLPCIAHLCLRRRRVPA